MRNPLASPSEGLDEEADHTLTATRSGSERRLAAIRTDLVERGRLSTRDDRLEVDRVLNAIRESLGMPATCTTGLERNFSNGDRHRATALTPGERGDMAITYVVKTRLRQEHRSSN
jgi:hypothetical protein